MVHTLLGIDQPLPHIECHVQGTVENDINYGFAGVRRQAFRWRHEVTRRIVHHDMRKAQLAYDSVEGLPHGFGITHVYLYRDHHIPCSL